MGTRNVFMLKTRIDSINLSYANGFVYENVIWALGSLWVLFCNYVLYSLGLVLRFIFRFRVEDRKREHLIPHDLFDHTKRNQIEDSKVDRLAEELVNLLFPIFENFHVAIEERGETDCPALWGMDSSIHIHQNAKKLEGETDFSVLKEKATGMHEDAKKTEGETHYSVFKEKDYVIHEDGKRIEGEREGSVSMEAVSCVHEDFNKIDEHETHSSVFIEDDSNFPQINRKNVEEERIEEPFVTDCISSEANDFTFSFQKYYTSENISDHIFSSTENNAKVEFSEHNLEEGLVAQEEEKENFVQEQRNITSNSTSGQILQINAIGGSDSSDYHVLQDNTQQSDFGSDSHSSKIDDLVAHQILSSNHSCEGFDSESLKGIKDERVEDTEETQHSCDSKASHSPNFHLDLEEANRGSMMWEDNLDESDFDEEEEEEEEEYEDEDEDDWENDEVVEQLRLELKNARQGGLATILEEEENQEIESPKVVEDLMPLKIEEKVQFKDHIIEIQKVYRCYAEKIRKLDVMNYQTMHAIGLHQLKLMLIPKSSVQSAKAQISQNLWPRKAQKQISDPILKLVEELHGDLELVYVGQICLSWEILCWQHNKVEELKQYDSQWPRSYNLVAGEFQLFQVLLQRFLEDEPYQGPRIQNYLKNRCAIRKLLQVPVIKDDNTKDKKIIKLGEEYAIDGKRLAQVMKESMRVFWEFVQADKDYGNVNSRVSHQTGIDVKDPTISDLLGNVRTQLHKQRKLKDILRSGNCIVRKFQKQREEQIQLDQEQLLAQMGLGLVSRVLHMKHLNKDRLIWCNEKLNRIKFVGRKVQVEPSFLFFPS